MFALRRPRAVRRGEPTLAAQFLLLQLLVIAVLLGTVAVLSIRQSTADFAEQRGSKMRSVAEHVANLSEVRGQLTEAQESSIEADDTRRRLAPAVDLGLRLSGASEVEIVSPAGVIVAATDPTRVGEAADMGESDALEGRGWLGDVESDGERAIAGHAPVYSVPPAGEQTELVGVVVAMEIYPTVWERLTAAGADLGFFLGLGALLGVAGAYLVSRALKRRTRGLGPSEFATLADHREALLYAIREGVVAVGTDQRVTMMNDAAQVTLGLDESDTPDPVGRRIDELGLDPHVVALLTGAPEAGEAKDAVALVGSRVVVFNRREASARGRGIGSVTTLRDRTELVSLQSRLSSNLSITNTLRAQTHEFDNRLHTISGLVQLGEYDEVTRLVGTLTRHRAEVADAVARRIADPAMAALIVAKHAVADERGVALELDPGSTLPTLPPDLVADLTTVVGNLVDNAVDACAGAPDAAVEVWLFLDGDVVHVRVRDNGPGVPDDLAESIFVRGFSTKPGVPGVPGGRGIGLPLVRLICDQRGGQVTFAEPPGPDEHGAEFRAVLPFEPSARQDAVP